MKEMSIPAAALRDPESVEMLRVWIAEKSLWCSIKVGMYREAMNASEETAWGTILADATRHIADALAKEYEADASNTIQRIRQAFLDELADPTSKVSGDFA
ncbi:uncharacterized protein DUF5076 [Bradyrhizobium macuxiense]|uniref:Uncharacterized protein DUF5076 n=1 Tax=Bradyrhizobium macuxiense TaxID=1755647 RepID=A0A560MHK9_9BRAD|nr:DUF5076 domain-containing protein [Bradyrhizobium macuxiense]TWC06858.1 uncharacterized protein DUF5076 [Bradyrhizobium macuxiense]